MERGWLLKRWVVVTGTGVPVDRLNRRQSPTITTSDVCPLCPSLSGVTPLSIIYFKNYLLTPGHPQSDFSDSLLTHFPTSTGGNKREDPSRRCRRRESPSQRGWYLTLRGGV